MYARITNAFEFHGNIALRFSFYLEPSDARYKEHHVYVVDDSCPIYQAGYQGKLDKQESPVDYADYERWFATCHHIWRDNPFHNHIVYADPDVTSAELQALAGFHLANFYEAWRQKKTIRSGWDTKHRIRPFRYEGVDEPSIFALRKAQCEQKAEALKSLKISPSLGKGRTFPATDIDIGAAAIDRLASITANRTHIAVDNPANATGTVDTFEVWAVTDLSGMVVGTFFLVSGTTYECRDSESIGIVTAGSKQTFSGLSIDVSTGDYAGCYFTAGTMERDAAGFSGYYKAEGEYIDPSDQATYTLYSGDDTFSLYGTGETPPVDPPTVTTQAATNVEATTATGNGNITDTGGENCSKRGVCWNTGGNPTVADDKSEETDSFGTGAFTRPMTGLSPATHYYVRAYAYNSEGYGYGAQVEFTTNKDCTGSDTGSGAEAKASGNPLATYARSETGGGVDGHKAVAPQSAGETGSGVDALTALLGILARSETGLGTDAKLSLAVALIKADAGSGLEHILDRALVLISESGSGLDVSHLVKTLLLTETGTGVENSYLHILAGVKSSSDSGSGAEASALAALLQRDETGEGVESIVARALYAREYPTGALDLAKVITAAITGAETGTGAEASLVSFYQKKTDSGSGVDVSSLVALFTGEDSGAGAEAITLLAAMVSHDTGVGVEVVIDFFRKLIDSGQGEENLHLVGLVGRLMKLITYTKPYSDLVVYTRPYSDLIVYTSEVEQ